MVVVFCRLVLFYCFTSALGEKVRFRARLSSSLRSLSLSLSLAAAAAAAAAVAVAVAALSLNEFDDDDDEDVCSHARANEHTYRFINFLSLNTIK